MYMHRLGLRIAEIRKRNAGTVLHQLIKKIELLEKREKSKIEMRYRRKEVRVFSDNGSDNH